MPFPNSRTSLLMAAASAGAAAVGLPGCGPDARPLVQGTGPVVQEQRPYRPIQRIHVKGGLSLMIRVLEPEPGALPESSGPETVVFLEGAQDLLSWVETTLDGDRLKLEIKDNARLDPLPSIEVQVGYLTDVVVIGSGDVDITDLTDRATRGEGFSLSVTGSAEVRASGAVGELDVSHVGSGTLDLRALVSQDADYSGVGSGEARLWASESFASSVQGSGSVFVHGTVSDERIQSSSIGSSELIRVRPSSEDELR